jgi:hypothetical protein
VRSARRGHGQGRDFWIYFAGQGISQLGSSFTAFALPLLVFRLTHSATNLALTMAANFVPYLLFGLVLGADVDRVNRKRMMVLVDLARGAVIAVLPILYLAGSLRIGWIYGVAFVQATLGILFEAGEFAAIPSLVADDELVTANGRVMATNSTAALRQAIVPNHLFGRVISVAGVLAWSAIPLGAVAGAAAISVSSVRAVYAGIGILAAVIAAGFALSPIRHGDRLIAAARDRREADVDVG